MTEATAAAMDKTPYEQAAQILAELARTNFDEAMDTARELMKTTNVKDAFEMQSELMRETFKRNIEASRQLNELTMSSYREVSEPMTKRMTEMFEKMKSAA